MIKIDVVLHSAITGKASPLFRMDICNDGTGTNTRGNYSVRLYRRGSDTSVLRTGRVEGHARKALHVASLVAKALHSCGFTAGEVHENKAAWKDRLEDRERGGEEVRKAWIAWAKTQPNPKPSWLVPWDGLSEPDKEADRQIFDHIMRYFFTGEGEGA